MVTSREIWFSLLCDFSISLEGFTRVRYFQASNLAWKKLLSPLEIWKDVLSPVSE